MESRVFGAGGNGSEGHDIKIQIFVDTFNTRENLISDFSNQFSFAMALFS